MAGTMMYMFVMLALASGMVVLMFGFSSTHSSMYTLQSSFDEHDRQLRKARQANTDLTSQISTLQKTVEEMRSAQQKLQASFDKQAEQLSKTGADVRQEVASQVRRFEQDLSRIREKQQAATTVQDDLKLQTHTHKASSEAIAERVSKAEQQLEQLSSKEKAMSEQIDTHSKVHAHLRGLVESLTQSLNEIRQQQKAQVAQLEDARHLRSAPTVEPLVPSTRAALASSSAARTTRHPSGGGPTLRGEGAASSSSSLRPSRRDRHSSSERPSSSQRPSSSSVHHGVSIPSSARSSARSSAGSSLSSRQREEDAGSVHDGPDSDHHALNYRRTADSVEDDASKADPADHSTSPSPTPSPAVELPAKAYQISWYKECGCTGMEIEAVTLLAALVHRLGAASVRTNKCGDTCTWPASVRLVLDQIEVHEDSQLTDIPTTTSRPGHAPTVVLVVHAAFNGVCGIPDSLLLPVRNRGDPVSASQRGLFRVSRSMLETDRLDEETVRSCNDQFDAIWVPSQFNVRTFSQSGVDKEKLHVLPEAVDTTLYNCSMGAPPQRYFTGSFGSPALDQFIAKGGGEHDFTFLSIFKWEGRKNWKALLETFFKAFPHTATEVKLEDGHRVKKTVRLLIKTQELSWGTSPDEDLRDLLGTLGADAKASFSERVLIFKDALSAELMPSLYHVADAFVLPTHGEGWGLPLMEAMASGLPTIATNWGGQTEYMNDKNSFLLGYELVESETYSHYWAEPKVKDLRQALWEVVRKTQRARSRAERGCHEVHTLFTPEVAAQRAVGLIAQLHSAIAHK